VNNVTGARPAGPLFQINGRLIRPGQDSSGHYGRGIVFHEVTELTPQRYREHPISSALPEWDPRIKGVHHFAHRSDFTVIDVLLRGRFERRRRFRPIIDG